jgi:hypothetical protein
MQQIIVLLLAVLPIWLSAQPRPAYCDALPVTYEKGGTPPGGSVRPPLPRFNTTSVTEYKVQVAILRNTDPHGYPFHEKLVARWRPCEQVWVVESRESFTDRQAAERLRRELENLGYRGAYITELVAFQPD